MLEKELSIAKASSVTEYGVQKDCISCAVLYSMGIARATLDKREFASIT